MNLQAVEDALRAWVKTATGFPDAQVYFGNQDGAQPKNRPFATIVVSTDAAPRGAYDEIFRTQDLTQPNGSEITQTVIGQRDIGVSVSVFAENTVTYPIPTFPIVMPGSQGATAVELVSRCQTALGLDGVRSGLNAAGIAPYDLGSVLRLDALVETGFEGRAVLSIRMRISDTASESVGYIAEVTGTGSAYGTGDTTDPRTFPYQAGP